MENLTFDGIKKVDESSNAFWLARDIEKQIHKQLKNN
jgi:hypothetical protein